MSTELPPELRDHQAEVKAELKARYQQRHGRDTLLQMRAELLSLPVPEDGDEAEDRCELLSWMDEKLDAIDAAEAQEMHRRFEASLLMPLDAGAKLSERIEAAVKALDAAPE